MPARQIFYDHWPISTWLKCLEKFTPTVKVRWDFENRLVDGERNVWSKNRGLEELGLNADVGLE